MRRRITVFMRAFGCGVESPSDVAAARNGASDGPILGGRMARGMRRSAVRGAESRAFAARTALLSSC